MVEICLPVKFGIIITEGETLLEVTQDNGSSNI